SRLPPHLSPAKKAAAAVSVCACIRSLRSSSAQVFLHPLAIGLHRPCSRPPSGRLPHYFLAVLPKPHSVVCPSQASLCPELLSVVSRLSKLAVLSTMSQHLQSPPSSLESISFPISSSDGTPTPASACALVSTEAALRSLIMAANLSQYRGIPLKGQFSEGWGRSVCATLEQYPNLARLDFECVHHSFSRYKSNLQVLGHYQYSILDLRTALTDLFYRHLGHWGSTPTAVIISRPPETITLLIVPKPGYMQPFRPFSVLSFNNSTNTDTLGIQRESALNVSKVRLSEKLHSLKVKHQLVQPTPKNRFGHQFAIFDAAPRLPAQPAPYMLFIDQLEEVVASLQALFPPNDPLAEEGLSFDQRSDIDRYQFLLLNSVKLTFLALSEKAMAELKKGVPIDATNQLFDDAREDIVFQAELKDFAHMVSEEKVRFSPVAPAGEPIFSTAAA
ncbi:uncharacterized protein BJ171DRAFT_216294, partial [Polychytrium aggregatum]|uniref:uncharacterized protein n=1 Tax=Polychytrium aggregatum TaxID=110093 RepID=UPI0022FE52A1